MPDDIGHPGSSRSKRLADSAYLSPYSHAGAPNPHPNTDPYADLHGCARSPFEDMGYSLKTSRPVNIRSLSSG